jgi:putative ABC transport system permease protein
LKQIENIRVGIRSILAHKLRSALTTLGIIFGVAGLVAMMSIAEGARREAVEQIRMLGTNNIRVNHIELTGELREEANIKGSDGLSERDVRLLRGALPNLSGVAPVRFVEEPAFVGTREATGRIVATNADYGRITDFHAVRGRFLSALDQREGKRVAVLGANAKEELFGFRNPLGRKIRIGDYWFTVVGLMEPKTMREGRTSVIEMRDLNSDIYVPISAARARFPSERGSGIQEIVIQVARSEEVQVTAGIVDRILRKAHQEVGDYEIVVAAQLLAQAQATQRVFNIVMGSIAVAQAQATQRVFNIVMGSIAAISLLVGGIGIMNIMLTTVTERTKEIGVRRALGATRAAVMQQFLVETVLMSAAGGLAGILVGAAMAQGISAFADWETVISAQSAGLAFLVSALVGVAFGLYPARRAAMMSPISALRFE